MSASLVGSEMCIRDSVSSALLGRLRHGRPAAVPCAVPAALADFSNSVSYTHLTLPTICSV
eukprot:7093018-Alexandrium_andersonii.AAC.1